MGCVHVHACVCAYKCVSHAFSLLVGLLCFILVCLDFYLPVCFLKRKIDGVEWDGWESLGGNGEGELTLNCTKTLLSIKKIKKSYDNLKINQDEGRRNPPHLMPSLILSR